MNVMTRMIVQVRTKVRAGTGGDDHVFIGVFEQNGRGGEFPLGAPRYEDVHSGVNVKYWMGEVGGDNEPRTAGPWCETDCEIDLDRVNYVYLRKQQLDEDDPGGAWELDEVEVTLFGSHGNDTRTFRAGGEVWLGKNHEKQVWLATKEARSSPVTSEEHRWAAAALKT